MRMYGFSALVAAGLLAGGFTASSASAADLGGNCCADLEERIAELEATTARKGNRKVSLTISGWIGQQVMWWDDGGESNVYVTGLGTTLASHFKMTGAAQISPGWSAGYVLQVELNDSDSLTIDQISQHNGGANGADGEFGVQLLQSYWFVKSDHLGKVSIGLQSSPSDNAAILVDGSGSLVPANWVFFDHNNFKWRAKGGGLAAMGGVGLTGAPVGGIPGGDLVGHLNAPVGLNHQMTGGWCRGGGGTGGDCFGDTTTSIRYDSPTWHGFSVSGGWGEDDFWDVAARYAGEWSGFKVAAAAAYTQWTPDFRGPTGLANNIENTDYFQAGLYVEHIPSGVFGYGAYGKIQTDGVTNAVAGIGCSGGEIFFNVPCAGTGGNNIKDGDTYYVKAGLRRRWHPLGHTVMYGEYSRYDDSMSDALINWGIDSSETTVWGVGVVQEIDSAAMSMWLSYRHVDTDIGNCNFARTAPNVFGTCHTQGGDLSVEDFQYVKFGALINF